MRRIVIVGGTSTIAEHCARLWLKDDAAELWLLGRYTQRLESVAADLAVRSPSSKLVVRSCSFLDAREIRKTVREVADAGTIDRVLIAHGSLPDQEACQQDPDLTREQLLINGVSPVLFAGEFAEAMKAQARGQIAVISSVAGDRGRKSNYVYGAAKGLVDRYVQGMQHRFAGSPLHVSLIKPGPTLTPMTAHLLGGRLRLANVYEVAATIVAGLEKGKPVIYAPGYWALIMRVIRSLPDALFNRLDL